MFFSVKNEGRIMIITAVTILSLVLPIRNL